MKYAILAATLLMSAGLASPSLAQVAGAPPELTQRCESCHGPGGNGTTVSTPRLNGQLSAYIVLRLNELADLTQNSPHATAAMYDIAHMSDSNKAVVADYFSHLPPTAAQPQSGKLGAMGQKLYANGDPANQAPACQSCHGANAEGQGYVPRLAGQHRDYLKTQLWNFNFAMRENSIMVHNAMKFNSDQIDALVAYLGAD
jgi:cytochrome c553